MNSSPFGQEPMSDHEILRALWTQVVDLRKDVQASREHLTQRLQVVEKWAWTGAGGVAVIGAVIVPLFIWVIKGS